MSKPHRPQLVKAPTKAAPAAAGPFSSDGGEPNPPKRRPLFLLASVLAVALWLAFLLWMAVR